VRIAREIEASVACHIGIGEQRDIGDSVTRAGKPRLPLQILLHHRQRTVSALV